MANFGVLNKFNIKKNLEDANQAQSTATSKTSASSQSGKNTTTAANNASAGNLAGVTKPTNAVSAKTLASTGSGGSSAGGATSDPYADYRSQLEGLYNKVMGYGSYTPGSYSAKYDTSGLEGQLSGWLNEIDNYEDFKYDLNADLLYKQMADNYVQQGQLAMQDTMAQAAALTGGYGNSYAASVGNQAYQQYLTQLNNNIPALQEQALNVWQSGLDQLMNQYNAGTQQLNNLLALEAQNFSQWQANEQNAYNAWLANYTQAMDQYDLGQAYLEQLMAMTPTSSGSSGTTKNTSSVTSAALDAVKKGYNAGKTGTTVTNPFTSEYYKNLLKR